jgi:hypothetical protein
LRIAWNRLTEGTVTATAEQWTQLIGRHQRLERDSPGKGDLANGEERFCSASGGKPAKTCSHRSEVLFTVPGLRRLPSIDMGAGGDTRPIARSGRGGSHSFWLFIGLGGGASPSKMQQAASCIRLTWVVRCCCSPLFFNSHNLTHSPASMAIVLLALGRGPRPAAKF